MTLDDILNITPQDVQSTYNTLQDVLLSLKDRTEKSIENDKNFRESLSQGDYLSFLKGAGYSILKQDFESYVNLINMSSMTLSTKLLAKDSITSLEAKKHQKAIDSMKYNAGIYFNYINAINSDVITADKNELLESIINQTKQLIDISYGILESDLSNTQNNSSKGLITNQEELETAIEKSDYKSFLRVAKYHALNDNLEEYNQSINMAFRVAQKYAMDNKDTLTQDTIKQISAIDQLSANTAISYQHIKEMNNSNKENLEYRTAA